MNDYTIDIKAVMERKFGKGKVAEPVIWILKKLFHIDFMNRFFEKGYEGVEFCTKCLEYLDVKINIIGEENLPDTGLYTFVSNHPLGAVDAVAENHVLGTHYGDIRFLANDFLLSIKGLAPLMVPVNKTGSQSKGISQAINDSYSTGDQMLIFPAGKVSRKDDNGEVMDQKWSKTFITKSVEFKRDVVPIKFIGQNTKRFYLVSKLDKWASKKGLKFPLAMVMLPGQVYRAQHKTYTMVIGKPIPWTTFDSSKTPAQWAEHVKGIVYNLDKA